MTKMAAPVSKGPIEHAIVGQLAAEADFDSLLAELLAETGGPLTDQERASARRVLRGGAA